jgi:hypothetical protein
MSKQKNTKLKLDLATTNRLFKIVFQDLTGSFVKFWQKLQRSAFGEAFLNLHFIYKSKDWIIQPQKETVKSAHKRDSLVGSFNLLQFFFYAYFAGFLDFGYLIYVPLIINLSLVIVLYLRSLLKRASSAK